MERPRAPHDQRTKWAYIFGAICNPAKGKGAGLIMPLPPRSPELNPVENVWQYLRDNWLSNRIFKSYDDIVALCCAAWNNLIERPWKIISIETRQWPYGF